jgi:hypothetical protein
MILPHLAMSSDNDPPAFRHLPGVRSTLDFIGQERFVGARSATTSNPLRSMRSPPPSPRRPTMPLWTSESTRPGLTRRFNDAFNGFRQQTLPPLAYPASRTNLDGLISFPNADLNRRRTLPGSPPRRSLLTLISAPSRPLPRVQCTSSIPITRISGQSVGPPNNAIRFPPLPATRGSSPEAFVEKKSRQGRHRTACDRCRGRKSKVSEARSRLPADMSTSV